MNDKALIDELVPLIRPLAGGGRLGIAVGGSRAKGRTDVHSDYDFRLYTDGPHGLAIRDLPDWPAFAAAWATWEERGVRIDGVWTRQIEIIDAELNAWIAGTGVPSDYEWAVWGYYLPTDIYNQTVLEDPQGVLAEWKARLRTYPPLLKQAVLEKFGGFLRYWREDYHYRSKVTRGDAVFLAGISARLAHAMMQVLFALNETYFPGDGWNLDMAAEFAIVPPQLAERLTAGLYPGASPQAFEEQYQALAGLIDDVLALAQSSSR
jgi:hypothetical protein